MVALPGTHRPHDGDPVHVPGDLRQVLADLEARDVRGNLPEGAAVVVAGLQVPQVNSAGAAGHPQQDAGALSLRVVSGGAGQHVEPARQG